jgi:hypothetical protein
MGDFWIWGLDTRPTRLGGSPMRLRNNESDACLVEISRDSFGSCWTLEDDRIFWRRLRGGAGLMQLWGDANRLTADCRQLGDHRSDHAFLVSRLHLMTACVLLSLLEAVPRMVYRELPHFFARFAAQAFCEMLSRAELVAEENPNIFRDNEWSQLCIYTYRSPTGAAAR